MAISKGMVAVAIGRFASLAMDIALIALMFTLVNNYTQGDGQSIAAGFFGLVTDVYDLLSLFDPSGTVSETPMVALGDMLTDIIGIISLALFSIRETPPAGAPWDSTWHKTFGVFIVFVILHAFLGIGRTVLNLKNWHQVKRADKQSMHGSVELADNMGLETTAVANR